MGLPTATVRMRGPDGIARTSMGMGTGPVDAAYKAIDSLVRVQVLARAGLVPYCIRPTTRSNAAPLHAAEPRLL